MATILFRCFLLVAFAALFASVAWARAQARAAWRGPRRRENRRRYHRTIELACLNRAIFF